MSPDYTNIHYDMFYPILFIIVFTFALIGWTVAYQLSKEVTELRRLLNRKDDNEQWKICLEMKENILIIDKEVKVFIKNSKEGWTMVLQKIKASAAEHASHVSGYTTITRFIKNVKGLVSATLRLRI